MGISSCHTLLPKEGLWAIKNRLPQTTGRKVEWNASVGLLPDELLDLGGLADPVAEVVELGPPDLALPDNLDPVDPRAVQGEDPLDTDAVADLPDDEGAADADVVLRDDDAFVDLDPLCGTLDDLEIDLDGISDGEALRILLDLSCLNGLDDVHTTLPLGSFYKFDKSSPNIGSLWIDPATNEPSFVSDVRMRDAFIQERCEYPTLVMDVQNGRASIPCLPILGSSNPSEQTVFTYQFAEFFNNDASFLNTKCVSNYVFTEFTGVVSYEGKAIDSRSFDYFKILSSCKGQWDILDKFTTIPVQPDTKLNILNQIGFNVQSLYDTAMCIIEPTLLANIASCVGAQLKLLNSGDTRQSIDFSSIDFTSKLMRENINRANGNFFTAGPVRPVFNNTFTNNAYVNYWGGNNGIR